MKRKIGLVIGYNGEGYHGLQYNGDLETIEKKIIEMLLECGCITEINSKDPQKIDLKACSRTDKGVHASFNVINVKIIQEPTEEIFRLLKGVFESKGIHLYKIVRLPKRFVGHKCARSRIYKYIVPTYFLMESNFDEEIADLEERDKEYQKEGDHPITRIYTEDEIQKIEGYRSDSIELFRKMMRQYLGTKNYHNFTAKKVEGDPKRYMKEITVSDPFYSENIEYVEVTIHGQSFLLHQIRKMISFAVLNCRYARKGDYEANFTTVHSKEDVHAPKSPSQYLFLSQVFFEDFNQKRAGAGFDVIEVPEEEKKVFEQEKIYPSILKRDNLYEWMRYLDAVRFHHDNFTLFKNKPEQ